MNQIPGYLKEFLHFRTTRSGSLFSNFYMITDPSFDLDRLLLDAAADQEDDPDPTGAEPDEEWVDENIDARSQVSSPLSSPSTSASSSRAPSPSRQDPSPSTRPQREIRPTVVGKKRAKKERARERRARKAARLREEWGPRTQRGRKRRGARRILAAESVGTSLLWDDVSVTKTGYGAKRDGGERSLYTFEDLIGPRAKVPGMSYLAWDGRDPTGVSAGDGRVFAALPGQPDDESWPGVHQEAAGAIKECGAHVRFPASCSDHRRGCFGAGAHGVSFGGGQLAPANLKHNKAMTKVFLYLIGLAPIIRIALFASAAFACWAPLLYAYYAEHMAALFKSDKTLVRNFVKSVWACITINFGPQTVTYKHKDFGNLPFGWCAITALGDYDPDRGGHLVLWECKLVVRFPPGSTVLIPSAIIHHSNTQLQPGEERFSMTQYTAGALFRWVDHDCKLDAEYYGSLSAEERVRAADANARRWKEGVHLWSTMSELRASAAKASGCT
ncbi:hypothetical protein EV714DRAFT_279250 [Schizophyllum commune]